MAVPGRQLLLFDAVTPVEATHSDVVPAPGPEGPAGDGSVRMGAAFLKAVRERACVGVQAVRVEFKPFRATLYSFRILSGVAHLKMHTAFHDASDEVLHEAAHLMLNKRRGARPSGSREAFDAFVRGLPREVFDLPEARRSSNRAREETKDPGVYRSMAESFERVNVQYFGGRMQRPRLCWSPVCARRIVGTYQACSDRVVLTRRLDSLRIPKFVLDFVMYHELLHKALGTGRRGDGKRRVHGPEFRRLERRFLRYGEAEEWLTKL